MKSNLHPTYHQTNVTCACGNTFTVGGTTEDLRVDVCAKCHPFFTGTQKFLDTLGRVDKFIAKRKAAAGFVRKDKLSQKEDLQAKSLKEMLSIKKAQAEKTEAVSE